MLYKTIYFDRLNLIQRKKKYYLLVILETKMINSMAKLSIKQKL